MRIQSNHSKNWYDSFRVTLKDRTVTFCQRDARRGGQVARVFTVAFDKNGNPVGIHAVSAKGGRVEHYHTTQCLSICVEIYNEALKAENVEKSEKSEKSEKVEHPCLVNLVTAIAYLVLALAVMGLVPAWYTLIAAGALLLTLAVCCKKPLLDLLLGGE